MAKEKRRHPIYLAAFVLLLLVPAFFVSAGAVRAQAAGQTASQTDTLARGIDVSRYNGTVNWNAVKKQDVTFVMIKTGDGRDVGDDEDIDAQFEANYEGAGRIGLKRGVYHVCYATTVAQAKAEARYCLKILDGRELEYPVAYDIEMQRTFALGRTKVTQIAKAFCDVIRQAGYTPMIYSSASKLERYFRWSKLKGIKVWVAHYGVREPAFSGEWDIWQYSSTGKIRGAGNGAGHTDLNRSRLEAPKKIKLNKTKVTLKVGKSFQITYRLNKGAYTSGVTYRSNRKTVASVTKKGKVLAKSPGKAKITVTTGNGICAVLTVKVKE